MGGSFQEITNPKKRAFLAAYAKVGLLVKAATIAGCELRSHYNWLKDNTYSEAFAMARQMVADLHEDEASRRAMGWDEERVGTDGIPYTIAKYSDTLLIVRLKAMKPEQYRERAEVQHSGELTVHTELDARLTKALEQLETQRNGHYAH